MISNGFDHFKYSVYIRFIRNTANPYSVYKKPNPNTAKPYSAYKKPNPNSFISYSVYKKRNYSVPYIFGFGRIIRIRLNPISYYYNPIVVLSIFQLGLDLRLEAKMWHVDLSKAMELIFTPKHRTNPIHWEHLVWVLDLVGGQDFISRLIWS